MFQKILLPIDIHHEESWSKALPLALKMLSDGGELHILGIVHDLGSAMVSVYLPKGFEKEALQQMKADLDAFIAKNVPSGNRAFAHVGHGHVAETILNVAGKVSADMIVMASHEPDEVRDFLVGSNANRIVRRSPVSVLVVRDN